MQSQLKSETQNSFPDNPEDWNLSTLARDTQNIHKFFEDVDWNCPQCGEPGDPINPAVLASIPNCICEPCYQRGKSAKIKEFKLIKSEERKNEIPEIYQETDPDHPGINLPSTKTNNARLEILSWNQYSNLGLWVVGDTRTGKTRSVCLLMQSLIDQGKEVKAFFHGSFGDQILEVLKSDNSFRAWKSQVMRAEILFIDDLFASRMTERTESTLFDVIDARITYKKPTLITTQLTGKEAKESFNSSQRLQAFFARINEFFQVVTIKGGK